MKGKGRFEDHVRRLAAFRERLANPPKCRTRGKRLWHRAGCEHGEALRIAGARAHQRSVASRKVNAGPGRGATDRPHDKARRRRRHAIAVLSRRKNRGGRS